MDSSSFTAADLHRLLSTGLPAHYHVPVLPDACLRAYDWNFAAARIAAEIAVSLTESSGKAQAPWQVYQQKLAEARRRDAQEGSTQTSDDGLWLTAR